MAIGLRADATPLRVVDVCVRCELHFDGSLYVDEHMAVVDSVAFIVTTSGPVCDTCIGRTSEGTIIGQ